METDEEHQDGEPVSYSCESGDYRDRAEETRLDREPGKSGPPTVSLAFSSVPCSTGRGVCVLFYPRPLAPCQAVEIDVWQFGW